MADGRRIATSAAIIIRDPLAALIVIKGSAHVFEDVVPDLAEQLETEGWKVEG